MEKDQSNDGLFEVRIWKPYGEPVEIRYKQTFAQARRSEMILGDWVTIMPDGPDIRREGSREEGVCHCQRFQRRGMQDCDGWIACINCGLRVSHSG